MSKAIKAIGSMFGLGGKGAAGDASKAVSAGLERAGQYAQQAIDTTAGELKPYTTGGAAATNLQSNLLGLGGVEAQRQAFANYLESPGQAFLRQQAEKSLLRNQAAIGGLGGGNIRSALQQQAIGLASQDYNNYYSNLANFGQQGLQATGMLGGFRQDAAQTMGGLSAGQGAARASGIQAAAENKKSGINNLLGGIGGYMTGGITGLLGGLVK